MYFVLYLNTAGNINPSLISLSCPSTSRHRHDVRLHFLCLFAFLFASPPVFLIYIHPSFPRPSASRPSCPSHLSSLPLQSILSSLIQLEEEEEEAEDEEGKERSTRGSACLPGEDISSLLELRARKRKKNSIGSVISRQHLRPEAQSCGRRGVRPCKGDCNKMPLTTCSHRGFSLMNIFFSFSRLR